MTGVLKPAVRIRSVQLDDRVQWTGLWDGYNAFYDRVGPTALAPGTSDATWARFLDVRVPVHALVAESKGKLVGLAHYLFHRSTSAIALSCYLQDLFVDASARGEGVGRGLIEAVYEQADISGAGRTYWLTHESNAVARRLYDGVAEHAGFIVYRRMS